MIQPLAHLNNNDNLTMTSHSLYPKIIPLPNGFQPEGVAMGRDTTLYVGSLVGGAIYQADLRNGQGSILVAGQQAGVAMGLCFDERSGYLFIAGGGTGLAHVYDTVTGDLVATYQLRASGSLINDVIVTTQAAYFTDYLQPVLYRLPIEQDGQLPTPSAVSEIPLGGDFVFVPAASNANGIVVTPDEQSLIVVHSSRGELYRVEPSTGNAARIVLENGEVPNGDGLLLNGNILYVVQNVGNQIAVVDLNDSYSSGNIIDFIRDPAFDIPTTIAAFDSFLYACNLRFGVQVTPDTEYQVVRVPRFSS